MLSGVIDDAVRPFESETRKDLGRQFLKRNTGLGVVDQAIRQDTCASDRPLTGNTAWNPHHVGAFAPIDHVRLYATASVAHMAAGNALFICLPPLEPTTPFNRPHACSSADCAR